MKTIDEIVAEKLMGLVHEILARMIIPDFKYGKVGEISKEEIARLKAYGIEGIIIDVDNTLRKNMKDIPPCNKQWIDSLRGELKVIILSNGIDGKIEQYFADQDIDYIQFGLKPLKRNFLKACEKMGVSPEHVLMVGDNLFDDIYGGKRNNMKTALITDVEHDER